MLALLRVFLDPRLYAAPGPRHGAVRMPEPDYIPEPVAPQMPNVASVATAAQPAAAVYEAEAYHQPVYDMASQGQWNQQNYATAADANEQQVYAQAPYASASMADYNQTPVYQEQSPQMQYDPNTYAQAGYEQDPAATPYTDGSAAVDMYSNPYLSGQTAGAIEPHVQPVQTPYDPNVPQG